MASWSHARLLCVVPGISPIWLSVHSTTPVCKDGKFKNWVKLCPPIKISLWADYYTLFNHIL